jgi:predicted nucleic acid-binding protein
LIVVDASVLVAALILATDQGRRARGRLELDSEQHAPDLMDIEVVAVIRRRLARGQLYVALAEALDAVLVTADGRLARSSGPGASSSWWREALAGTGAGQTVAVRSVLVLPASFGVGPRGGCRTDP